MIQFLKSRPELVAMAISMIVTALFKPRTEEEYAGMNPYLAKALVILAAIFPDPVKLTKLLTTAATGTASE